MSFVLAGLTPSPALGAVVATEWPQFRGGPSHQASDLPSTITPANVSTLGTAWHADIGPLVSSPAVVDGVVYVGANASLYALPATCRRDPSCAPLWTGPAGAGVTTSPAVAGGVVYAGSDDHKLYAFDAAGVQGCAGTPRTCAPLWTATTGDMILSSASVAGGRVYVGSDDDKLYAFDANGSTNCGGVPKTCAPLWTAATGGNVMSSPAVSAGVVFVGSDDGNLYAFDAAGTTNCSGTPTTCAPLWKAPTGGAVQSSPTVANGVVHVGSLDGKLYAFDAAGTTNCSGSPKTCAPLWSATTGGLFSSPAVANGVVYVGSFDRRLYAFDATGVTNCSGAPRTCAPLWTALTSTVDNTLVVSSPSVANGLVFIGTGVGDHYLHAFDAAGVANCSGTPKVCSPLWSGDTGSSVRSSPAVAGGNVYVGRDGVGLLAFGLPPSSDGAFHPIGPHRFLDTRAEGGPLGPGASRSLTVTGRIGMPATGVSAVVLNVAVTQPTSDGWLTLSPSGTARPLASSINFAPGQTVSNTVVAKVGAGGAVDIYNAQGSTHVVVDIQGWFGSEGSPPGARYTALAPARVLDTRESVAVGPASTLSLTVPGRGGVPAQEASAVVLNVAVTQPTTHGYLTVFPHSGGGRPIASSINFAPGQTVSNKVVVATGQEGRVDIFNSSGATHVVVDVEGWFGFPGSTPGDSYRPVVPARILDTRAGAAVAPKGTLSLPVTGRAGVPATGVSAVVLNVTVTQPTAIGYLTVFPSAATRPLASSVNFAPGQNVANAVVAKVGADGKVDIFNAQGTTHVVVDVQGWFAA